MRSSQYAAPDRVLADQAYFLKTTLRFEAPTTLWMLSPTSTKSPNIFTRLTEVFIRT